MGAGVGGAALFFAAGIAVACLIVKRKQKATPAATPTEEGKSGAELRESEYTAVPPAHLLVSSHQNDYADGVAMLKGGAPGTEYSSGHLLT